MSTNEWFHEKNLLDTSRACPEFFLSPLLTLRSAVEVNVACPNVPGKPLVGHFVCMIWFGWGGEIGGDVRSQFPSWVLQVSYKITNHLP